MKHSQRSSGLAESRRPLQWPPGLSLVASSGNVLPTIGHAVILRGNLPDYYPHDGATASFSFALEGTSAVEWKRGGRLHRFIGAQGGFTLVPSGEESSFYMPDSLETLNVAITPPQLQFVAECESRYKGATIELSPVFQKHDAEIMAISYSFANLLRSRPPFMRLYAETLWTQLAIHLLWNFSSLPRQGGQPVERLSDARMRRVIDYLQSSLAEEVCLTDLADLAGLSPNYFLNAFKKATGKTPHRYLTELRVAKACELLRNPHVPIVGVALSVGFSSQSHFTTVFGRFMKTTPSCYRTQVLGLGPDR